MPLTNLSPEPKQKIFEDYLGWNSRHQLALVSKESYSLFSKIVVRETLTISNSHVEKMIDHPMFFFPSQPV